MPKLKLFEVLILHLFILGLCTQVCCQEDANKNETLCVRLKSDFTGNKIVLKCRVTKLEQSIHFFGPDGLLRGHCPTRNLTRKQICSKDIEQDLESNITSLTINRPITKADIGEWRCTHGGSQTYDTVVIKPSESSDGETRQGIPIVKTTNAVYYRTYGHSVTIRCMIISSPNYVKVYWQRTNNGKKLIVRLDSPGVNGSTVTDPSLTTKYVTSEDSGQYTCYARNIVGIGKSEPTTLTVLGDIPKVTITIALFVRTYVTLYCTVRFYPNHTSVYWQRSINKRAQDITPDSPYVYRLMLKRPSLTIEYVTSNDSEQYKCNSLNVGIGKSGPTTSTVLWDNIRWEDVPEQKSDLWIEKTFAYFNMTSYIYQQLLGNSVFILLNSGTKSVLRLYNNKCYMKDKECSNSTCSCFIDDGVFKMFYIYTNLSLFEQYTFGINMIAKEEHGTLGKVTLSKFFDGTDFSKLEIAIETIEGVYPQERQEPRIGIACGKSPFMAHASTSILVLVVLLTVSIICTAKLLINRRAMSVRLQRDYTISMPCKPKGEMDLMLYRDPGKMQGENPVLLIMTENKHLKNGPPLIKKL